MENSAHCRQDSVAGTVGRLHKDSDKVNRWTRACCIPAGEDHRPTSRCAVDVRGPRPARSSPQSCSSMLTSTHLHGAGGACRHPSSVEWRIDLERDPHCPTACMTEIMVPKRVHLAGRATTLLCALHCFCSTAAGDLERAALSVADASRAGQRVRIHAARLYAHATAMPRSVHLWPPFCSRILDDAEGSPRRVGTVRIPGIAAATGGLSAHRPDHSQAPRLAGPITCHAVRFPVQGRGPLVFELSC